MIEKLLIPTMLLTFSQVSSAAVLIQFDDFEGLPDIPVQAKGISLDPNGGDGAGGNGSSNGTNYGPADAASVNSGIGWRDVSGSTFTATVGDTINGNARWDQAGNGGGSGMRVRANTGAATLDSAMPLLTIGLPTVVMEFDINLDDNSQYSLVIQYSADAAFTSPITLATYNSNGSDNGGFLENESVTITDGVAGVVFTDDAYFMIRRDPSDAIGNSNSTFHVFDNISITAVPEPSVGILFGLSSLGFLLRRR
ncbi:PEP-CTERM sorting domain-containing protein [Roseibacillus persicicus]